MPLPLPQETETTPATEAPAVEPELVLDEDDKKALVDLVSEWEVEDQAAEHGPMIAAATSAAGLE